MSLTTLPVAGGAGSGSPDPDQPPPGRIARVRSSVRGSFSGTPGRLRLIAIGAVLAVGFSAVVGAAALSLRSEALNRASSTSAHLLLLQQVQTNLVEADADATNSFLKGGLEPQEQRLGYIDALDQASRDLAQAAQDSDDDDQTLGAANAALTRYAGYVSSARAYNREGKLVGASYLKTASALLESDVLTPVHTLAEADAKAVDDAFGDSGLYRWVLLVAAVVGIGGLVWAQMALTRRSHRYVNLPLAVSTVGLVLMLVAAAAVMSVAQSEANDAKENSLQSAQDLSNSRVDAFAAKSNESLTLISQGSATPEDKDWTESFTPALRKAGSGEAADALTQYGEVHKKINDLDVDGDWVAAKNLATADGDGSANALFSTYDELTETDLRTKIKSSHNQLSAVGDQLVPTALVLLLVGLLCAAGAWWGVSFRLDEYR